MTETGKEIDFSPILIMEFIRQVSVARCLNSEQPGLVVKFKLSKAYYEEIKNNPLQVQFIRLYPVYDEETEILSVKPDEVLLNRFREQKSLMEIAGKYEEQFAERYKNFIKVQD